MKGYLLVTYISVFIWILVPYFYRNHNNFYFFLFLAINDIAGLILYEIFSISAITLWLPIHYLALVAISKIYFFKHVKILLVGIIIPIILAAILSPQQQTFVLFLFHLAFLFYFIKKLARAYMMENLWDYFFLVLIFYEIVMVIKLLAFVREISVGIEVYWVGTIIQIFIGITLILMQKLKRRTA